MTTDPEALESAARALFEQVRTNPGAWEHQSAHVQEEVRGWARKTVQAYLDAARGS